VPVLELPEKKCTIWALTAEQMKECQFNPDGVRVSAGY
jgi:hypothetical protein